VNTEVANQSDLIYHHTDHGGITGILSYETFRFSHIDYLNDSSERTYVHSYIDMYIEQEKLRHANDKDMLYMLDGMLDENRLARSIRSPTHYISCFTTSPNELSQWRGYARTVPGYAIAFRRDALVGATSKILEEKQTGGVRAGKVTYLGPRKGKSLVSDLIQARITRMKSLIQQSAEAVANGTRPIDLKYEAGHVADLLHSFFTQNRPESFKHDAFYQEQEFRIAINLFNAPSAKGPAALSVYAGAASMKPYIELTYGKDVMRSLIDHLIVGPTPERELACRALKQYCTSLGYDFRVEYCDIPFRPGW
jgi:hypothetical protein